MTVDFSLQVALLGHGRMGKEVEKVLLERGHTIALILDSEDDWVKSGDQLKTCTMAIEFSQPGAAAENLERCITAGVPVVSGTTGWMQDYERIRGKCMAGHGSLFHAANFSISVNIFFEINRRLADLMNHHTEYEVNIEETHHINKLDAPSGTAIFLANDILKHISRKEKWIGGIAPSVTDLEIKSLREENVPGTHIVTYESVLDAIEIKHTAKSRRAFAIGAVLAAEWLKDKEGIFGMRDLLGF